MKPFDHTKPCKTRDGREVTELTLFRTLSNSNSGYPLRGVVDGEMQCWTVNGDFVSNPLCNSDWDLVNIPEKKIVPLGYDDVMPGDLVEFNEGCVGMITWKTKNSFYVAGNGSLFFQYLYNHLKISKDGGKTWQPFSKEVEI